MYTKCFYTYHDHYTEESNTAAVYVATFSYAIATAEKGLIMNMNVRANYS